MTDTIDPYAHFAHEDDYPDLDLDAAATYGIVGIPTTYFIDADGRLVAYASSALDAETLQAGIDMIYG